MDVEEKKDGIGCDFKDNLGEKRIFYGNRSVEFFIVCIYFFGEKKYVINI